MTIDEKKAKVQAEANKAIDANGGFGLIAMATGTGKSKIGVDRVDNLTKLGKAISVLLVVPTEKLRDEGWRNEFDKWDKRYAYSWVQRTCYASLHTYEQELWDLVILDECHNITENNSVFFKNNDIRSCIGLTATPPTDLIKIRILSNILKFNYALFNGKPKVYPTYEVTLDQAVQMGLVASYDITVVVVPLDTKDKYIETKKKDGTLFYQTEAQKYAYLTRQVDFGSNPMNRINRMQFIARLRYKTITAMNILKHVIPQDKRTLIFCGSKKQANEVCQYRYYSKPSKPKKPNTGTTSKPYPTANKIALYNKKLAEYEEELKEYHGDTDYNLFVEEKINRLACVEALNEGHNLPLVDCALVIQLNSKELDFIQRMGRIIRLREGHTGKIIIIVAENTVDVEWAQKATANLDGTKIRWISLDDLRNARKTITF